MKQALFKLGVIVLLFSAFLYSSCKKNNESNSEINSINIKDAALKNGFFELNEESGSLLNPIEINNEQEAIKIINRIGNEKHKTILTINGNSSTDALALLNTSEVKQFLYWNKRKQIAALKTGSGSKRVMSFDSGGDENPAFVDPNSNVFGSQQGLPSGGYNYNPSVTFVPDSGVPGIPSAFPNVTIQTSFNRDANGSITDWSANVMVTGPHVGTSVTVQDNTIAYHPAGQAMVYTFTATSTVGIQVGDNVFGNTVNYNYIVVVNPNGSVYANATAVTP